MPDVSAPAPLHRCCAPVFSATRNVLETERRVGIRSTWFVIAGTLSPSTVAAGDITYRPESRACRRILDAVSHEAGEIALHGSFATMEMPHLFSRQRMRLEAITAQPAEGVRQHFLRMQPGVTQGRMARAGFRYDSTFGFSDRNGFRLGVADVVPVWDHAAQQQVDIDEVPFAWMDRALSKYRGVEDPDAWIDDAFALAVLCREVEGVWCGIWHPNLAPALGFPGAPVAFARLCDRLMQDGPWAATMGEIVRWRRRRRGVRAVGEVQPGRLCLQGAEGPVEGLTLEDASGNRVPFPWA